MDHRRVSVKIKNNLWTASIILSLFFAASIIYMWYTVAHTYHSRPYQLNSPADVTKYLNSYEQSFGKAVTIPTGVFVQSFHFANPNQPVVTGYIWQKYSKEILQQGIKIGYSLPESGNILGQGNEKSATYDIDYGSYRLLSWRFAGIPFYQLFDYRSYPFDEQVFWIRIWPEDFYKNVMLVPDFEAYKSTQKNEIFGVEHDLPIQDNIVKETYFEIYFSRLNSNFGFQKLVAQNKYPDFYFNIVIKRKFTNAFIMYIIPIFVVWGILFVLAMVITSDEDLARMFNFSTTGTLSALGATFFSVLIAQINLRAQFIGHPITYIEYFYFVTYLMIFLQAINTLLTTPGKKVPPILEWQNNLIPKVLYWPFILGFISFVTLYVFFLPHESLIYTEPFLG